MNFNDKQSTVNSDITIGAFYYDFNRTSIGGKLINLNGSVSRVVEEGNPTPIGNFNFGGEDLKNLTINLDAEIDDKLTITGDVYSIFKQLNK